MIDIFEEDGDLAVENLGCPRCRDQCFEGREAIGRLLKCLDDEIFIRESMLDAGVVAPVFPQSPLIRVLGVELTIIGKKCPRKVV